ncbi:MAG: Crp/Fnr family transcriptional regulator [Solirubrobacterales bacterium]|nr:Crp/Fnr family transcriptional regulator [Solirubrobacterales bacterium]
MLVRLLEFDPDLGRGIDPTDLPLARQAIVGVLETVASGRWIPDSAISDGVEAPFAALVIEGLMTRERAIANATSAEIIGPGDVLDPWSPEPGTLPGGKIWTAMVPTKIAVLDRRFLLAVRRWPLLAVRLFERVSEQNNRISMHVAINGIRKVEQRILAMLWHLADLYGKVRPDGVIVPLRLSHEAIGHLVGARRPTVSLALSALIEQQLIRTEGKGGFLLLEGSRALLAPEPRAGPVALASGF